MALVLLRALIFQAKPRPGPTAADVVYGKDSERQEFDFWQAKAAGVPPGRGTRPTARSSSS